jgi:molybdopterin-dependent oxidoreductase alpha subunit
MRKVRFGGGWQAIAYALRKARELGPLRLWRAMRAKNACKTCAFGMGGQLGGMTNEARRFPEVCKKSLQAMAADMQGRIEPRFFETYDLRQLQAMSPRELEHCGRLASPVVARPGDTHYRPIPWDEALDLLAGRLKSIPPRRAFFYASGRSSNEAGFLLQLLARAYGTNHVSNCSYYCHQASGVGLKESVGATTATLALEDLERCDMLFLIGGNPASNHPRLMTSLMRLRQRGGRVVVVNPLRETGLVSFRVPSSTKSMLFGSEIASTYVQVAIGGDIAFLAGVAKAVVGNGTVDAGFVESATEGFAELQSFLESLSWEEIERSSGVGRGEIEAVALEFGRAEKAIFAWTMGITHHEHGVENVQWIANLALLRGMVGKEAAGLMPIRGHSNVQGMGSVGVTPAIRAAMLEGMTAMGIAAPEWQGHDTLAALAASSDGEMDFALCLGGNLYGASPDAAYTASALAEVETVAYMSTTLNTGHAHGLGKTTLILPVRARDEESQCTTQESMFSYVRVSDGGPARLEGPRSEVEILASLGDLVMGAGGALDWKALHRHDEIRKLIARLIPELGQMETIGQTKREFEIPGRVLHEPRFGTPSGRAAFRPHPLPALPALEEDGLRLMTARSEGQFNTVVYEEKDLYRGQERRDVILMNAADIARLGLEVDGRVEVFSETGRMVVLVREFDIARGCAMMYYPEANALVSRKADPRSRTPAFKSVVVRVRPAQTSRERPSATSLPQAKGSSRKNMKAC